MSKNLKYHVALTVKDQATSGIKKAMAEMERGETKRAQSYKRFSDARRNLSIRAESDIQREIKRTEASYNRLARAGFSSANEQRRAYQAMTNRVRELNAEMGKTSKLAGTFNNLARIGGGIAAGATVGYNLAKEPVKKTLDFDYEVANAANTAFSDRDTEGRMEGAKDIRELVFQTIQQGGSKEDALAGINKMLSFGTLSYDEVAELMPTIQKTAVATGSSTEDISMVVNALMQSMKLAIDEIPLALDMALKAGQGGSFELGDMSKWLPQQLASASSRGMRGMDHYREILVMNEQAAVVAGTNDQAGNYVDSFLLALLDSSTNNALANSDYKEGNKKGIDLAKSMMAGVDAGLSPVQAFMGIMDKYIAQDAEYQKLEKEILSASGAEREAKLQQLMTILESSKISQILGNKQALMGFLAVRLNQEYGEELTKELEDASGAVDISHEVVSSQNKFKTDMAVNNQEWREMEAYRPVADAYASLLEKLEAYGSEYPELTKSIILARDALITLGTAAAGMALLSKVLGKGGGGIGTPWGRPQTTVPGSQTARPTANPANVGGKSKLATAALGALRWAPVAGEAYALYEGSKDDIGNIVDKHDGFTPGAAKEITETGYEKTIKPIVDTALTPFSEAFKSFVNAFGLGDEKPAESTEAPFHPGEVPVIGELYFREPLLKERTEEDFTSNTDNREDKSAPYSELIKKNDIDNSKTVINQNSEYHYSEALVTDKPTPDREQRWEDLPEEAITKSIDNHIENHDTYLESIEETQNIDKSETTINQIHEGIQTHEYHHFTKDENQGVNWDHLPIGQVMDNYNKLIKEQSMPVISSLPKVAKNPDYQPLIIGGEIMNLVKQNLEQIKQQHNEINSRPTIIELHVNGEIDGRQVMEIVEQHTIDRMNRGSNY
ncbi:hypothetical protein GCM10007161_05430 [Ignatzschineria indica]|uniref:Phage tail tape measure protein domain-containing protein n=1 Tax=Ignatzschineria indica TaxID=472583 RepID=A0A2U2AMT4_9GAMM|nr:phage tail tape measure protein [Ignatzschineria indica]PWD84530.1 hypothetical protein DC082_03050 [Ignatzschineria indica]GGZ77191.1 hypothetical protein GCM10007161_05430 [Ignatzschineria indica]